MSRRDVWSGSALAAFALFAVLQSTRLQVGSVWRPGPGFFPLLLAAALALVAVMIAVRAWRSRARTAVADGGGGGVDARRLLLTIGAFAAYVLLFERLGFLLASGALLAFLFGALGRYRWPFALAGGAIVAVAAYVVFDYWLAVRLPPGPLGRW